ncbi:MAG: hypothetical protein RL233_980 [Bacteroidota bacterium]|jgi:hypothetical protein
MKFNGLILILLGNKFILLVCKFIYKELLIGEDIRGYNKYLCKLKVISFIA